MVYLMDNIVNFVIIGICALIVISLILIGIIRLVKKNSFKKERAEKNNEIIIALGGRDNIVSFSSAGSRLSLVLNDYSLMQDEKLKELGVSSIIKMSSKVTLVIGKDVEEIVKSLS